jgi:hypothetical protein
MSNTELIYSFADFEQCRNFYYLISSALIFYLLGNNFGYKSGIKFAKEVVEDQLKILKEYGNCLERNRTQVYSPEKGGNDDKPA